MGPRVAEKQLDEVDTYFWKRIFVDTVSRNKNYAVDTVSTNKSYAVDTVSTNKNHAVDTVPRY